MNAQLNTEEQPVSPKIVDELVAVKRQLKQLESKRDNLVAEIKELLDDGEIVLGSDGRGFRKTFQERVEFTPASALYLAGLGILPQCAKVQKTMLDAAHQAGTLSSPDYDAVIGTAKSKRVEVLLDWIPEEAKVFA